MSGLLTVDKDVPSLPKCNFEVGEHYHYYDADHSGELPNKYQQILATAEKEISIWDPYFDPGIFENLFDYVTNEDLKIFIVTTAKMNSEDSMNSLADNLKRKLKRDCKLKNFSIKIIMRKVDINGVVKGTPKEPHDRFLIIDNTEAYLVGASTSNHLSKDKSHGICELNKKEDVNLVIKKYKEYCGKLGSKNSYNTTRNAK